MNWFKKLLGLNAKTANCVPRAFANCMAWAITHKTPVWIADVKGHFQSVGQNEDGELIFLEGNGWDVWEGKKEGTNPIYKLRTLDNAMAHFIKHNPTCMPTAERQAELDERIKREFRTDPEDVA